MIVLPATWLAEIKQDESSISTTTSTVVWLLSCRSNNPINIYERHESNKSGKANRSEGDTSFDPGTFLETVGEYYGLVAPTRQPKRGALIKLIMAEYKKLRETSFFFSNIPQQIFKNLQRPVSPPHLNFLPPPPKRLLNSKYSGYGKVLGTTGHSMLQAR